PEAVLPAGSAYRLRVLGTGRGAGFRRRAGDPGAVRLRLRARPVYRPVGREGQAVLLRLCGLRPVLPVDRPVPDQYRGEHRPAADQGPDLAVPQLRWFVAGDLLRQPGGSAAYRMGAAQRIGQRGYR